MKEIAFDSYALKFNLMFNFCCKNIKLNIVINFKL